MTEPSIYMNSIYAVAEARTLPLKPTRADTPLALTAPITPQVEYI